MEKESKTKPIVGVDARPLSYGYTGNSRYLAEALKYLGKESAFQYYLYLNKPIHPVFHFLLELPGIQIRPIREITGILWLNFLLPGFLKRDRVDIFWGTLQLLPFRKLPIPSVVNYHDLNFRSAPKTMDKLNYYQHKAFSRFTLQNADRIFCLSQNTLREIAEYRPNAAEKLRVIYPGANRSALKPKDLPYKDFIFTVGTLEPRKNISTLIKSFVQLKSEYPDYPYSLLIAGRMGWGDPTLAEELKTGKYHHLGIVFLENPSDEELLFLYRKCQFFVFPSIHEGFGLPLIEAIVENKLCIGSDIPVFREILDSENDLFVNPLNIEEWKQALLNMQKRKSRERIPPCSESDWNWRKTANEIEEELTNVWKKTKGEH